MDCIEEEAKCSTQSQMVQNKKGIIYRLFTTWKRKIKQEPQKQKYKNWQKHKENTNTHTEEDVFVWHKVNIARTMASCQGFPHCSYTESAFPSPSGCGLWLTCFLSIQSVEYINLASITSLQIVDLMLLRPLITAGLSEWVRQAVSYLPAWPTLAPPAENILVLESLAAYPGSLLHEVPVYLGSEIKTYQKDCLPGSNPCCSCSLK